jgi:GTP-binding protein HflX
VEFEAGVALGANAGRLEAQNIDRLSGLSYHNDYYWTSDHFRKGCPIVVKENYPKNSTGHVVESPRERGFLVGARLKVPRSPDGDAPRFSIEDSLEELAALADTAGIEVLGGTYQRLERIHPATYIGQGKVEELQRYRDELDVDVFLFDDELSPGQQRELERALDRKIVDRTALILDIFAQHAHTREGQLQVTLAQYEYRLPRLTRLWTHLARQAGGRAGGATGGVGVRGPGETQLEADRREIRRRIAHMKRELDEVRAQRAYHRQKRRQAAVPTVAIVGYTNAGKSTLLNALSDAGVLVADMLFATLDPTTRRVTLPGGREILFTDTVGFIQKLPTDLVAAFRATLEEIGEADLILHIVDITHRNALEQATAVEATLRDIGATESPVLVALNKIDRLADPAEIGELVAEFPHSLPISARTGQGIDVLLARIESVLDAALVPVRVRVPYREGGLVALLHECGNVEWEEHGPDGTLIEGRIPARLVAAFRPYAV